MKHTQKYEQLLVNANDNVKTWINTTLEKYLSNNIENQDEIEHVIDYLLTIPKRKKVISMSYHGAVEHSIKWMAKQVKQGEKITEKKDDTEIVLDFKNGFKIVRLIHKRAYQREGKLMSHCVASYSDKNVEVYSLRDINNKPHATMEKDRQIKGKGNGSISPKYVDYIVRFLEHTGMKVGSNEMKNLGYVKAPFLDICESPLYRNEYFYGNIKDIVYSEPVEFIDRDYFLN